jgi:phage terminase large subunit-like protein
LNRILRKDGNGKAEAVAATPNARDGARTTFEHLDESHRITLDGQRRAWSVMLANLAKRPMADPWALETTTAPEPGAGSVAETTMDYVLKLMAADEPTDSRIFFYHREAGDEHDLTTRAGLRAAIIEASGPYIGKWTDVGRIMRRFDDGDADRPYAERVWLNRRVQSAAKAFDVPLWQGLARLDYQPPAGAPITLGFDGSRFDDATGLVATEIRTGFQWVPGLWEHPAELETWEVPADQVDGVVADLHARYRVTRMYCDPPKWESWIASWAGRYGDKKVLEWWTNRRKPMAYAIRSFIGAMAAGELSHSGDARYTRHVGNACRLTTNLVDEEEKPLWILRKERPKSPHKIDLAMCGILSWEARNDAIAAGEGAAPQYSMLFLGGK